MIIFKYLKIAQIIMHIKKNYKVDEKKSNIPIKNTCLPQIFLKTYEWFPHETNHNIGILEFDTPRKINIESPLTLQQTHV
jgi:hypothetical protein